MKQIKHVRYTSSQKSNMNFYSCRNKIVDFYIKNKLLHNIGEFSFPQKTVKSFDIYFVHEESKASHFLKK